MPLVGDASRARGRARAANVGTSRRLPLEAPRPSCPRRLSPERGSLVERSTGHQAEPGRSRTSGRGRPAVQVGSSPRPARPQPRQPSDRPRRSGRRAPGVRRARGALDLRRLPEHRRTGDRARPLDGPSLASARPADPSTNRRASCRGAGRGCSSRKGKAPRSNEQTAHAHRAQSAGMGVATLTAGFREYRRTSRGARKGLAG
jgi:hypothetical protein